MLNKLFLVCLLLIEAAELMEGRSAIHERNVRTTRVCLESSVKCSDGQCISQRSYCAGFVDCSKNSTASDVNCPECQSYQFACASSTKCIDPYNLCNGFDNCGDGSDELDCGDYEGLSDINVNSPPQWLCTSSIQEECSILDFDKQSEGRQRLDDVLPKLTEIDLREICTPVQEWRDCALASFNNSQDCLNVDQLVPELRLEQQFASKVVDHICEANIEALNRGKSCLKLDEQDQLAMISKLMVSCASQIIAHQSSTQPDKLCIPVELQQCVKNVIAEECGDDIAEVVNGVVDLAKDYCEERQKLHSPNPTDPVEQPSTPTSKKRHTNDSAKIREMLRSIF